MSTVQGVVRLQFHCFLSGKTNMGNTGRRVLGHTFEISQTSQPPSLITLTIGSSFALHAPFNFIGIMNPKTTHTLTPLNCFGINSRCNSEFAGVILNFGCTPSITLTLLTTFRTNNPKLHLHFDFLD